MNIQTQDKTGIKTRVATLSELKALAKDGNMEAVRALIEYKGGFAALTATQKDKVLMMLLGYDAEL